MEDAPVDLAPAVPAMRAPSGTRTWAASAGPDPSLFATYAAAEGDALLVLSGRPERPVVDWVNRACAELLAYAPQELEGRPVTALQRSPFAEAVPLTAPAEPWVDRLRTVSRPVSCERRDGSRLRLHLTSVPVGADADQPQWVVRLVERAELDGVEEDLRAEQERFRALSERAPIGIFSSESGLRLGYVNDEFCHLLGRRAEQLLGTEWLDCVHAEDLEPALTAFREVLEGRPVELPLRLVRSDGELRHVQARLVPATTAGRGAGFLGTLEDVTQRLAFERTLAHQALHDPLTGLPNRRQLVDVLLHTLGEGSGTDRAMTLLFLDLDDFKHVNDSLGHEAGDLLLIAFGKRLRAAVREGDLVARFGGDEFAVLCLGVADEGSAAAIAERILAEVTVPLVLGDVEVRVAASMGVVVADAVHRAADEFLRDADAAMYQAKAAGKSTCALFDEQARRASADRAALLADLRRALAADELSIAYQPIFSIPAAMVDAGVGSTVSVEALVRWDHPERGLIGPDVFVPLAEQHGLVVELGTMVLGRACRQLVAWRRELGASAPASVAVNVSPLQLRRPDFVDVVAAVLADTGLPGRCLTLELTESVVMHDPEAAARAFRALRALGVSIALDDFGTGYSSLALLRTLPLDELKIDRSFLSDLGRQGGDPIVAAIVALAASLGLGTIAEGVETRAQLSELDRLGCPRAQGYLVSRPLWPADLTNLLRDGAGPRRALVAS